MLFDCPYLNCSPLNYRGYQRRELISTESKYPKINTTFGKINSDAFSRTGTNWAVIALPLVKKLNRTWCLLASPYLPETTLDMSLTT